VFGENAEQGYLVTGSKVWQVSVLTPLCKWSRAFFVAKAASKPFKVMFG